MKSDLLCPLLRLFLCFPDLLPYHCQGCCYFLTSIPEQLRRNVVHSCRLSCFQTMSASCASAHVGCQPLARGSDYFGVGLCLGGVHSCVLTALLSPPVQNSCALSQVVDDCCSRCDNGKEEKYEHPALSPVKDKADATDKCSSARVAQHSIYSSRCSFLSARARSRVHTHTHTHTYTHTHTHTHTHTRTHTTIRKRAYTDTHHYHHLNHHQQQQQRSKNETKNKNTRVVSCVITMYFTTKI